MDSTPDYNGVGHTLEAPYTVCRIKPHHAGLRELGRTSNGRRV
jgi:hypothetical protein